MMEYLVLITDMSGEILSKNFVNIKALDEKDEDTSGMIDLNALAKKGWRLNNMTSDGQPNTWIVFVFEKAK